MTKPNMRSIDHANFIGRDSPSDKSSVDKSKYGIKVEVLSADEMDIDNLPITKTNIDNGTEDIISLVQRGKRSSDLETSDGNFFGYDTGPERECFSVVKNIKFEGQDNDNDCFPVSGSSHIGLNYSQNKGSEYFGEEGSDFRKGADTSRCLNRGSKKTLKVSKEESDRAKKRAKLDKTKGTPLSQNISNVSLRDKTSLVPDDTGASKKPAVSVSNVGRKDVQKPPPLYIQKSQQSLNNNTRSIPDMVIFATKKREASSIVGATTADRTRAITKSGTISISPKIARHISKMIYPDILLGEIKNFNVSSLIMKRGKMNDRTKRLFTYINTVLQFPPCVRRCSHQIDTRKAYGSLICRYVLYTVSLGYDEDSFRVEGSLMVKCLECKTITVNGGIKLSYGSPQNIIMNFRNALTILHECFGIYQNAHLSDVPGSVITFTQYRKEVPNINLVKYSKDSPEEFKKQQGEPKDPQRGLMETNKHEYEKMYSREDAIKIATDNFEKTAGARFDTLTVNCRNVAFLVGYHLLSQEQSKQHFESYDTVTMIESSCCGKVPIFGIRFSHGNATYPTNKSDCFWICRNKDLEICLVSAMAFSLWFRLDFSQHGVPQSGNIVPDLLKKGSWDPIKMPFRDNASPKSKTTLGNIHDANLYLTCTGTCTNLNNTDAAIVPKEEFRRTGGRKNDVFQKSYPDSYPFQDILSSGGFELGEKYQILRNIPPPPELEKLIFPWLDDSIKLIESRNDQEGLNFKDKNKSVLRFLQMLKALRSIILQDLALWMLKVPNSVFCTHPITKMNLFIEFATRVQQTESREYNSQTDTGEHNSTTHRSSSFVAEVDQLKTGIENAISSLKRENTSLTAQIKYLTAQFETQRSALLQKDDDLITQLTSVIMEKNEERSEAWRALESYRHTLLNEKLTLLCTLLQASQNFKPESE